MKIDFKGILEGAWNSVFVKESIEKVAAERIAICRGCSKNSDHQKQYSGYKSFRPDFHCTVCGCDLHMKTRCMSCECPMHKWVAQASENDEQQIDDRLKSEENDSQG